MPAPSRKSFPVRRRRAPCLVAPCWALALAPGAFAQEPPADGGASKSVHIVRTSEAPAIDGRLDEAVWSQATVIEDFHQVNPREYAEPSERTRVSLLYDSDALYVGVRLYERSPDQIINLTLRQGDGLGSDDRFFLMIDPFNNRRSGYLFGVNPNGVRFDGVFQNVTERVFDWDGIWHAAAGIDDQGWTIEYVIPFKTISFDPANDTWGMNFMRNIVRANESIAWVSRDRRANEANIMGEVTGLTGLDQGLGLDIVPSVSWTDRKSFLPAAGNSETEPSLDVFYKLTPSLNGSLTINTDFSATEVDDRQVNLTRFDLFFPEKRDFFLQDVDIFQFGRITSSNTSNSDSLNLAASRPSQENGRPFFSRRLGLGPSGEQVDLKYGSKVSGRVGQRWDLGALAVRQDGFNGVDETDAFVGRVVANLLAESSLGMILTSGDSHSNVDNTLVGVDFRYLNSRLPGGRRLEGEAWYQQTDTDGLVGNDTAAGFGLSMPNNTGLRGGLAVKELEENFNPALGFVSRTAIRDHTLDIGYTYRFREGGLRTIFSGIDAQRIDFVDGEVQSEVVVFRALELDSHQRDQLNLRRFSSKEGLREPFEISQGVIIPPGVYSFDEHEVDIQTGNQRKVSGGFTYRQGDFFDGERLSAKGTFRWRPTRHFRTVVEYEFNDVELPQGDFITRLVRVQLDTVFSSTLSWVNLIQYDNISETAGINSRLHWIPQAGREAFIVLNHNLEDTDRDNDFNSSFSELNLKFNYTLRF